MVHPFHKVEVRQGTDSKTARWVFVPCEAELLSVCRPALIELDLMCFSCEVGPTNLICFHPDLIILWNIKLLVTELVISCHNTPRERTSP